jgi:hypothetical protein
MAHAEGFDRVKGLGSQEEIKKTPEEREALDGFTLNEVRTRVILTPEEVAEMRGHFPFTRIGQREVNGEIIEETQELYRFDALGRLVRNDDIAGLSWRDSLPIPHDRISECPDHYDFHGTRLVFLGVDGSEEYGTVLCSECKELYEKQLKWQALTLGLIIRARPLKERRYVGIEF